MRLGPTTVNYVGKEPGDEDPRGNQTLDDLDPVTITGCRLDRQSTDEQLDQRDTIHTRALLFVPPTIPDPDGDPGDTLTLTLTAQGHFIIDGERWEVDGDPDLVDSHIGPHHYEINVVNYEN